MPRLATVTPRIGLNILDHQGNLYELIGHRPDALVRNMQTRDGDGNLQRMRGMVDLRNIATGREFETPARALGFYMCWNPGDPTK